MSSRWLPLLAALLLASTVSAQEPAGHHAVRLGFWLGHVSFADELNFDGDQIFGIRVGAEFSDWVELNVALGQMTMRDQRRDVWSDSVQFDMQWRFIPFALREFRAGALAGVSFTGFEEDDLSDAVAEGLDLGLAGNWNLTARSTLSADVFWRMQSFNLFPRDSDGNVVGSRAETGYVWTQMFRMGVGYAF